MLRLRKDIRDIKRFEQILATFLEEGLGYYVKKGKLRWHLPFHKNVTVHKKLSSNEELAIRLRKAFERLGPTFIKLGQLLSLRPDLVPEEFAKEFSKLQGSVRSFPYKDVKKTIEEEFGQSINKLFKEFDKKPIACASMAQVHRAKLKNGEKVAVKVQRPNVKNIIDEDLDILFYLAKKIEKHSQKLRDYCPTDIVKEFAFYTRKELDFRIESNNANRLREQMKKNKNITIPEIFPELSSRRVLTMAFEEGVRLDNSAKIKRMKIDRSKLAITGFMNILEQVLIHGFFHADPHPANIFVQKDGKILFLDFGIVGELTRAERKKIIQFFSMIPEKNTERSVDIILSLAKEMNTADLRQFRREASRILEEVYFHEITEKGVGRAVYEVISIGSKHGVIFDPNHVLMAKAIYQGEGLMLLVDPKFKVVSGIVSFIKKYIRVQFSPKGIAKKVTHQFWSTKDFIEEFPEHVQKIIEKIEEPEAPQRFDKRQLRQFENDLRKIGNRKNAALITSLLIIASVILFYLEGRTHIFGIPMSVILFIVAVTLLVYLILKKV